jgi:hypothetical protein
MHPALDGALAGFNPTIFGAVEILLPNHAIRLLTGSGIVVFDGKTFTGQDATYGTLHSVEDLTDGTGDDAPAINLTLVPASDAAAADLAGADMQGASVSIWLGAVEPTNGLVIGEPLLIFLGVLDVPTLKVGANSRLLEFEITSAFEALFMNDDGARLNDRFHSYVWPGETGLSHVTSVTQQIYWGGSPASGVTKSTSTSGAAAWRAS